MLRCAAVLLLLAAARASPPVALQRKHTMNLHQAVQTAFLSQKFAKQKRTQQSHSTGTTHTFHAMPHMPNFMEAKNMCIKADDAHIPCHAAHAQLYGGQEHV